MALPLFKEKRLQPRRRLSGLMPGKMVVPGDDRALSCKPIDISVHGLGVLISEKLNPGSNVVLQVNELQVRMTIAWRQPDFGKRDLFRYGLVTEDPTVNLEELFTQHNCFK